MTCAVCGSALPNKARFCPSCGAPAAPSLQTQERKLVTVLFADLVDSTGLAQRLDPERAREVLGRFYDAVTEELRNLRGEPEKFIGDAVMAVFGLPQVHEDDAVRAVRAGLAIRGRLRRLSDELGLDRPLEVHVGVETGEAATGVSPSGQLLVTGAVVNAAARLQSAAGAGEVLAGATTWALTERSVSFGPRRDVQAKGFDAPLDAYPVEGLTTRSARRTIPIVGRTAELTMLREAHARVIATQRPLLVTVLGEPGIGKSRLADEFVAGVELTSGPTGGVLVGRNQQGADSATFAPVAGVLVEAAGIEPTDPPEKALRRLRELVEMTDHGGDADRVVARLGLVLGLTEPQHEESTFVQEVQAGFLAFVSAAAARGPVTIVFEDAHTLGPPMLDLIERIVARGPGGTGPVLVLVAARAGLLDERSTWGGRAANHILLNLEPLSDDDAVALARQAGGGRLDEAQAGSIATRAGGNPFFIIETTGMLLGRQARDGAAGSPPDAADEVRFPPTVQAIVASRLDALPDDQRELTRRLSVYMYSFDEHEAALIADCSEGAMQDLIDAEIVVRDAGVGMPRWRFRHETLRDVAYASLPKRTRLELHRTIAESLLEAGNLSWAADHLECAALASIDLDPADRTLPVRAAGTLASAGDRARRRMENRSAVDHYERSLALAGARETWGVEQAQVLAGMGEARYWLGDYPQAREALVEAERIGGQVGDDWTCAHALRFLGDIAINVDADLEEAERLLARSLEAAERLGDPRAIARTLLFAGWVPWTRERYPDAEPMWRRALELARGEGDRWAQVRALTSLSINREHMDDFDEAQSLIEEAYAVAEAMDDQFSAAVATVQRGRLHEDLERYEEALADFKAGVEVFEQLGARWEMADALAERGIANRELGRLDDAEDDLSQAVRISEEMGERQLAGWTWRALARVAEKRGDRAQADERFRRAAEAEAERPQ